MLLIVAALEEELETGMALCQDLMKIHSPGADLWQASREGRIICFLKAGIGPRRSAASLDQALTVTKPSHIMVTGYAGALDANLKLGNLVAVKRALAFSLDKSSPSWDHVQLDDSFELVNWEALVQAARSAGLIACAGDALTSSYILGEPEHKRLLYEKFHASIVDMETAALARVAASRAIPLSCIRAISDEAQDTFLAPFSHNPSTNIPARAKKLINAGMIQTYREWKDHAAAARENLARFLRHYI